MYFWDTQNNSSESILASLIKVLTVMSIPTSGYPKVLFPEPVQPIKLPHSQNMKVV